MNAIEILKQHKIKKSTPRVAIIQALQKRKHPLSETEIKEMMGNLYDLITFYRNVQTMIKVGILHRIVIDNIHTRYALNNCEKGDCQHTPHAHFYCRKCNEVTCLNEVDIETEIPKGYVPEELEVLIQGICNHCNTNK
jgi:Fur family transcriptional regulator, ferric uptake regulator